jgi:hypothetical protein
MKLVRCINCRFLSDSKNIGLSQKARQHLIMKDLKVSTWIFCQKGKILFDSHKPKLFETALQERECKSYQDYYSSKPHEKVLRKFI